jgi:hypothetical protein
VFEWLLTENSAILHHPNTPLRVKGYRDIYQRAHDKPEIEEELNCKYDINSFFNTKH